MPNTEVTMDPGALNAVLLWDTTAEYEVADRSAGCPAGWNVTARLAGARLGRLTVDAEAARLIWGLDDDPEAEASLRRDAEELAEAQAAGEVEYRTHQAAEARREMGWAA
jgi:hypothetical protein